MEIYRISLARWSDKLLASGRAARWNSDGIEIIYAASYRSLACLENIVHRNRLGLTDNFKIMILNVPESEIKTIDIKDLGDGWNGIDPVALSICRKIGDDWVKSGDSVVLNVPSAIIKDERNYLINPKHADFDKVKLIATEPFFFDPRLKD